MYSIGYDIGSSSIKCSIFDIEKGEVIIQGFYPEQEMEISSPEPGWAEQNPETWWEYVKIITKQLLQKSNIDVQQVKSIGISYQMHGLVVVDKKQKVLRPSIIWCDSRAVNIGNIAFEKIGSEYCLNNLLNSPGNFTASKLRWIKEDEPDVFKNIYKIMLPGDFIAMKLTGEINTTVSGLSEGIFWDFQKNEISRNILDYYEIDESLLPDIVPTFSIQGYLTKSAAEDLGLKEGVVVAYRAGDQPNNAFSLNVLNPGEVAATAGTSGVVYAVIDKLNYDNKSRVNQFAHVNHSSDQIRIGVLLCINGTGILNSFIRKNMASELSYNEMNNLAQNIEIGCDGLSILPFGNGAERMFENKNIGSHFLNVDFNRHTKAHFFRAVQEGIAFAFKYGIEIINEMGLSINVIRAGNSNLFLSPIFRETLANLTQASIELYDTDGAQGAARAAAYGANYYKSLNDAFKNLEIIKIINHNPDLTEKTFNVYNKWLELLKKFI